MPDDHDDRSREMLVEFNPRTYRLGIANGIFGFTGSRLADPTALIPLLIHRLSGAAWVVGVVLGLKGIVEALAQVAVARGLDARDRKKPAFIAGSTIQTLSYITCAAVLWFADSIPNAIVLIVLLVALLAYRAGLAISGLTLQDIVTKSVPTTRRGSLHMWRKLGALVLVFFVVTPFVQWMIGDDGPFDFPRNFGVLFAASVVATAIAWLLFAQVKEPPSRAAKQQLTWNEHLRRGVTFFRSDSSYRRVVRIRLLVGVAAGVRPFLIVFATDVWNLADEVAAIFIAVQICAEFAGALIAGFISDRQGNRRAILLMIWAMTLCCAAAVIAAAGTWDVPLMLLAWETNLQVVILGGAFVGSGLFLASMQIGYANYLMDIAPEHQRPSYIGFSTAFTLPLAIAPMLYGWGADLFGYQPAFVTALVLSLVALYLFLQLPEPRDDLEITALEQPRHPTGN
ncbi:MAG: MFS transporter [candidate division WS1 bacterium]|nr:MFS transporter [candidate division WS1 bacterium]